MAEFKAGMKVRHKSGGPVMIVERIGNHSGTGQPRVWCEWFDATNFRHNESFVPEVLEEIRETPPADRPLTSEAIQRGAADPLARPSSSLTFPPRTS
jgi:uncharacterized protein YodC (DUF2158 family)